MKISAVGLRGHVDKIKGRQIRGWLADPAHPLTRLSICVSIDGQTIGTYVADQFREDLLRAGIGDGAYSFAAILPSKYFDGEHHELRVSESLGGAELNGHVGSVAFDARLGPSCIGKITGLAEGRLSGYVYDRTSPDVPIDVILWQGDGALAQGHADRAVVSHLLPPGAPARCGFEIDVATIDLARLIRGEISAVAAPHGFEFEAPADLFRSIAMLRAIDDSNPLTSSIVVRTDVRNELTFDVRQEGRVITRIDWHPSPGSRIIELCDYNLTVGGQLSVRLAGTELDISGSPLISQSNRSPSRAVVVRFDPERGVPAGSWIGVHKRHSNR